MAKEKLKDFLDLFVNKDEEGSNSALHSFIKDKMKGVLGIPTEVVQQEQPEGTEEKPE